MKLGSPTKTQQLLIIASALLLLMVLACAGLFYLIKKENEQISLKEQGYLSEEAEFQRFEALEDILANISNGNALLDTYFVGANGAVSFIELVESLGAESGAAVEIASVSTNPVVDWLERLELQVTVRGDFASVFQFLSRIEAVPYQSEVTHASLRRITIGDEPGWSLALSFYALKLQ